MSYGHESVLEHSNLVIALVFNKILIFAKLLNLPLIFIILIIILIIIKIKY